MTMTWDHFNVTKVKIDLAHSGQTVACSLLVHIDKKCTPFPGWSNATFTVAPHWVKAMTDKTIF
jgi:hypothetical protein